MPPPITNNVVAPLTLNQYAQTLDQTNPTRVMVENIATESDLLRAFQFKGATAGKAAFLDIGSLPGVGFRPINAPGNESSGSFNLREEDTFFIDEYIKVDRALVDRLGSEHRQKQRKLKSKALAQMCSQVIIKGDNGSNASQPNGLQVRCNRLGYNLVYAAPAGTTNPVAGGSPVSMTALDQLWWLVNKPTHWIMPRGLMPYFDAAARNSAVTGGTVLYKDAGNPSNPDFGYRVITLKGLPILFGYEPDDTPDLLPFNEVGPAGGGAVTGSIYCVALRDGGLYGIEQTPMSMDDEGLLKGSPFLVDHFKWDWGIAREHPRSCARLAGVTNAPIVA